MKIGNLLKGGFACGVFTSAAIIVPVAVIGTVYGCVEGILKIKEHHKRKKTDIVLKPKDYIEVD